jgi:hypothetical protein
MNGMAWDAKCHKAPHGIWRLMELAALWHFAIFGIFALRSPKIEPF